MCQRPASTLGTWVMTHPPPLCWVNGWWREQSLDCRSVCPDNPHTCDDRDWTVSHNLYHYQDDQTHRVSDDQVSCVYPLQCTITSEPAHNLTHRVSPRARPWQPTLIPASSSALYLETAARWTARLTFLWSWNVFVTAERVVNDSCSICSSSLWFHHPL